MRINTSRFACAALAAMASSYSASAAERIRYDEIPTHIVPFGRELAHRGFNIVTQDHTEHHGRRILVTPGYVRVIHRDKTYEDLPSGQVQQIRISQAGRFFHHIPGNFDPPLQGIGFCLGGNISVLVWCTPVMTAASSPFLVGAAVATPFILVSDGVTLFIPPKVYEIVH